MKARKIVRNRRKMDEKGVSPVIGVILMVAATIVIAAVVMTMIVGFTPPTATPPSASITIQVVNNSCFKLVHTGGDTLVKDEWQIAVCSVGESPKYINVSANFGVGDTFYVYSTTTTASVTEFNNLNTTDGSNLSPGNTYEVYIKHLPTNSLIMSGKRVSV